MRRPRSACGGAEAPASRAHAAARGAVLAPPLLPRPGAGSPGTRPGAPEAAPDPRVRPRCRRRRRAAADLAALGLPGTMLISSKLDRGFARRPHRRPSRDPDARSARGRACSALLVRTGGFAPRTPIASSLGRCAPRQPRSGGAPPPARAVFVYRRGLRPAGPRCRSRGPMPRSAPASALATGSRGLCLPPGLRPAGPPSPSSRGPRRRCSGGRNQKARPTLSQLRLPRRRPRLCQPVVEQPASEIRASPCRSAPRGISRCRRTLLDVSRQTPGSYPKVVGRGLQIRSSVARAATARATGLRRPDPPPVPPFRCSHPPGCARRDDACSGTCCGGS